MRLSQTSPATNIAASHPPRHSPSCASQGTPTLLRCSTPVPFLLQRRTGKALLYSSRVTATYLALHTIISHTTHTHPPRTARAHLPAAICNTTGSAICVVRGLHCEASFDILVPLDVLFKRRLRRRSSSSAWPSARKPPQSSPPTHPRPAKLINLIPNVIRYRWRISLDQR